MDFFYRKDFIIYETRQRIYIRDNFLCQHEYCLEVELELAHRIAKGIGNQAMIRRMLREIFNLEVTKKQAKQIINMDWNLVTSCRRHNSSFSVGNRPVVVEKMLKDNIDDISKLVQHSDV